MGTGEIKIVKGLSYRGLVNKTKSGKDCQVWSSTQPHSHDFHYLGDHNYCRNPLNYYYYGEEEGAWCYTTDPGTTWDFCEIRDCVDCDHSKENLSHFVLELLWILRLFKITMIPFILKLMN